MIIFTVTIEETGPGVVKVIVKGRTPETSSVSDEEIDTADRIAAKLTEAKTEAPFEIVQLQAPYRVVSRWEGDAK